MIYQLYTGSLSHLDRLNWFRNNRTCRNVLIHPSASISRRTEFYGDIKIENFSMRILLG